MPEPLQPVAYAPADLEPHGQLERISPLPFAATLERLKAAIAAEDLWLIHEIDPEQLLARGGYCILPVRQLLFFHPRFMARLLEANPNGLVEAPLKLVLLQRPGGGVSIHHPDVAVAFARHPGLEALGIELASLCRRVVDAVAGEDR